MTEHAIDRPKRYELIAEQLLAQIGRRSLLPGDPLPTERELTQRYGAGRSSVREALRMLESRGVIVATGAGSFAVAAYASSLNSSLQLLLTLDQATMHDIYELRRILECEAAAIAAERRSDAHLEGMDAAIEEMAAALPVADRADGDRYIEGDLRFHLAVAEATRNGLILHSMRAVRDVMRRALTSVVGIPGSAQSSLAQHRAILEAIAARDADRARSEMRAHLVRVERDAERAFTTMEVEVHG